MAVFANVTGQYVIQCLASCVSTVVTTTAVASDRCMIEIRRYPGIGCVAAIAIVAAGYVRWVFADRDCIVVAGIASTNHLCMIYHQDWLPKR